MKEEKLYQDMPHRKRVYGYETATEQKKDAFVTSVTVAHEDSDNYDEDYYLSKMMEWLMPWAEKTEGLQILADWEMKLPEVMMVKLLKMWLSDDNREKLDKVLHGYHPLDRAAMAYALLIFVLTGTKIHFNKALSEQHFKVLCRFIEADMPELSFADHLMYNLLKFGKKHIVEDGRDSD